MLGGCAAFGQVVRERHQEAARVGRGEQLLGTGAPERLRLGPPGPADVHVLERGARRAADLALTGEQVAAPRRVRFTNRRHVWVLPSPKRAAMLPTGDGRLRV